MALAVACAAALLSAHAWAQDGALACGPDLSGVVSPDGRHACVSEASAGVLEERGWVRAAAGAWDFAASPLRVSEDMDAFAEWVQTGDGGWRLPSLPEIESEAEVEVESEAEARGRRFVVAGPEDAQSPPVLEVD